jgi:acyl carrier protein
LDQDLEPVPIGVAGELYTGGDGLALEYLNQPELTAAKFIPNPFDPLKSSRLYRTGDRVRWRPDGNLEFLGRSDEQVKIRGYRVEPGEVANVLAAHPAVHSTVVVVGEDPFIGKQLLAYVVLRPGYESCEESWRQFLGDKLPVYMMPAHFICLASLPLTPNGKVDRRALPPPARSAPRPAEEMAAPRTPTESLVASIWCELLGRERVGIHEDFFRIGGHSLLATQVLSRVGKEYRLELPVAVLFEAPTVAKLAARIEQAQREQPARAVPPIAPSGSTRAAELLARLDQFSEAELEALLRDPELQNSL